MWRTSTGLDTNSLPAAVSFPPQARRRQVGNRPAGPAEALHGALCAGLPPPGHPLQCPSLAPSPASSWPVSKASCPSPGKLRSTAGRVEASPLLQKRLRLCLLTFVPHLHPSPLGQNHRDGPVGMRSTRAQGHGAADDWKPRWPAEPRAERERGACRQGGALRN